MRRLLGWFIYVPKTFRPACPPVHTLMSKNTSVLLCKSSSQGGRICNGTHSEKPLLSDPQLFEAQFKELVLELTEKDIADPALADALSRLREVCLWLYLKCCVSTFCLFIVWIMCFHSLRFWCTMFQEGRETEGCLWLVRWESFSHPLSSRRTWCSEPCWLDGA